VVLPSHFFFLFRGSFPALPARQKQNPTTRKQVLVREVRSPANFVDYIPLPHPPLITQQIGSYAFLHINSGDAAAGGKNLPMPLHCPIFALGFFYA
jgi:hypothetical protein